MAHSVLQSKEITALRGGGRGAAAAAAADAS